MFNDEFKKTSIIKIFNEMDYEEKTNNSQNSGDNSNTVSKMKTNDELGQILKISREPKSFDAAVEAAVRAQNKWRNSSALKRANSLHKVWKDLKEIPKFLSKSKNEFNFLIDYFDYYSDLTIQTEEYKSWRPVGVVLIGLSNTCPFFILGITVPAALAAGCSVIVLAPKSAETVSLLLEEKLVGIGLPEGLLNVVTEFDEMNLPVSKKINKIFFCGSHLSVQIYYKKSLSKSFNYFCPKNTAALVLESCDLNAAVDKIVKETWGENSLFTMSDVIVQESIYKTFLGKLKYRMEQFMIENKDSSIFKCSSLSEKINNVIFEALNAGASIESSSKYENEWSPTVIINYQNQDIDEDVPIIKVLLCRTAKEGIALLNNCKYTLGVSIWSDISSEALEISSMLICPNVWINCHGVFEAGEPLQLRGFSGNCVLGGSDGILEFISFRLDDPVEGNKNNEDKNCGTDKIKVLQLAAEAQKAFDCWQQIKNKRKYLKDLANSLEDKKELSKLSESISYYAHFGNIINFSNRNFTSEFSVIKRKVPIGAILLLVNTSAVDIASLISLITPALVLGNVIIVVLKEENSTIKSLFKHFSNVLPRNILNIIIGIKAGIYLSSDPNIQAIWLYDESTISTEFFQTIKSHSVRGLKHIWVIPKNISFSQHLFQKECLINKVVWLPKVDQFP